MPLFKFCPGPAELFPAKGQPLGPEVLGFRFGCGAVPPERVGATPEERHRCPPSGAQFSAKDPRTIMRRWATFSPGYPGWWALQFSS